jgi:hypothetical protein
MLPPTPRQPNDAIDVIFESVQRPVERIDENGQMRVEMEADNKSLFYRMLMIPNQNFGGCILEIEKFIAHMNDAVNNMCFEVSEVIKKQGLELMNAYLYAFASKSSETVRDKDNVTSSLTHVLQRNHVEKTVRIDDKTKGGFGSAMGLGNDRGDQDQR